jgi:hypothetical protein
MSADERTRKSQAKADWATLAAYHEARLAELLDHVRESVRRFDVGELDAFEVDDVIHRYTKAARELWKFCAVTPSHASERLYALEMWAKEGEAPDWWQAGASRRR